MSKQKSKENNKKYVASLLEAFVFSPWLVIIYFFVNTNLTKFPPQDLEIIKNFIEWFGTAYSLFLALVLVNVWNQFETTDREFDLELDALATMYHTIRCTRLPETKKASQKDNFDEIKERIKENIKNYIEHVRGNYSKEHSIPQLHRNGDFFLEKIGELINRFVFSKALPNPIISQLYETLSQAMDARGDRIAHSKQQTRGVVLLVAYVASAIWLLSFFGLPISTPLVSFILVGGASFVIVMVITIIRDLDKPFEGSWQVDLNDWDELLELIVPGVRIVFVYNIKNTIIDSIEYIRGKQPCKLRSLSRSGLWGSGWKKFLKRIARKSDDPSKKVSYDVLFLDDFSPYSKWIGNCEKPIVFYKQGDDFGTLLNSSEINECSDLSKLEMILTQKFQNQFDWYIAAEGDYQ